MDALRRSHLLIPVAGLAGAAWGTTWAGVATSVVLLPCWGLSPSRGSAFLAVAAYYAGGARELPAALAAYYQLGALEGVLVTAAGAALLALPWAALWSPRTRSRASRAGRAAAALVVAGVPPFGLAGVCHPLTIAGTLLPGLGWWSVGAAALLLAAAATSLPLAAVLVTVSLVSQHTAHALPAGSWRALDTALPSVPAPRDYRAQFERATATLALVEDELARAPESTVHLVLPETAGGAWTRAMQGVWEPLAARLEQQQRCLLLGVLDPRDAHANGVRAIGACDGALRQRIPLPGEQVPHLASPGAVPLARERVGVLICFEAHLVWPVLHSMGSGADALVVLANLRPLRATRAEVAQRAAMTAWARAFDVPLAIATNR